MIALLGSTAPSLADTVFATQTLRPREVITSDSVAMQEKTVSGAAQDIEAVIGSEVRRAVYAGRPIMLDNVMSAASVERNQVVRAVYVHHGLTIEIDARALERGAPGDFIEAMNISSHKKIQAEVQENGQLRVLP